MIRFRINIRIDNQPSPDVGFRVLPELLEEGLVGLALCLGVQAELQVSSLEEIVGFWIVPFAQAAKLITIALAYISIIEQVASNKLSLLLKI